MAGPGHRTEEAALWRRWRSASASAEAAGTEPDAVLLAAYAERRLSEEAAAGVEDWLVAHPEVLSDVLAAQDGQPGEQPETSAAVTRAQALVSPGDAQILDFPQAITRAAGWRRAALWSSMAASLAVTSLIGFSLGNSAYLSLVDAASPGFAQELFDPPTGLFNSLDEDPNT